MFSVFSKNLHFGDFKCFWIVHLYIWSLVLVARCNSMWSILLFSGHVYEQNLFFHIAFHGFCGRYWPKIDCPVILYLSYSLLIISQYIILAFLWVFSIEWYLLMNVIIIFEVKVNFGLIRDHMKKMFVYFIKCGR